MRDPGEFRPPVVLGVDARYREQPALAWAGDEAERRRAPLRLVHADPAPRHGLRRLEGAVHRKAEGRPADQVLAEAAARARGLHPGLEVSTLLVEGAPAQVLCEQSAEARMVVLGSRGMSRLAERFSANAVAEPVSARAACPVAVVVAPGHTAGRPPYLVVGLDGSPGSGAALEHALAAAGLRGVELRAVWVWEPNLVTSIDEVVALQKCRRLLFDQVAGPAERYPNVVTARQVVRGHPVDELAKASEQALAVVVGRSGSGGMRLGSVPHGLLHRAHCPVVTVPPPEAG